jgi:long-subunit fatty acid transport protein
LDGAASYEHQNSFSVGIGYQYFFTNRYSLKPEIHWQSSLLTSNNISTTGSNVRQDIKLQTINIPVLLSYLLNDYFYLEAGPVLHFETLSTPEQYIDPQNGLGFSLGIGLRHSFSGFTVFAKPNIHLLSLLPFKSENYHQRLLSAGFTFGFGYNF